MEEYHNDQQSMSHENARVWFPGPPRPSRDINPNYYVRSGNPPNDPRLGPASSNHHSKQGVAPAVSSEFNTLRAASADLEFKPLHASSRHPHIAVVRRPTLVAALATMAYTGVVVACSVVSKSDRAAKRHAGSTGRDPQTGDRSSGSDGVRDTAVTATGTLCPKPLHVACTLQTGDRSSGSDGVRDTAVTAASTLSSKSIRVACEEFPLADSTIVEAHDYVPGVSGAVVDTQSVQKDCSCNPTTSGFDSFWSLLGPRKSGRCRQEMEEEREEPGSLGIITSAILTSCLHSLPSRLVQHPSQKHLEYGTCSQGVSEEMPVEDGTTLGTSRDFRRSEVSQQCSGERSSLDQRNPDSTNPQKQTMFTTGVVENCCENHEFCADFVSTGAQKRSTTADDQARDERILHVPPQNASQSYHCTWGPKALKLWFSTYREDFEKAVRETVPAGWSRLGLSASAAGEASAPVREAENTSSSVNPRASIHDNNDTVIAPLLPLQLISLLLLPEICV